MSYESYESRFSLAFPVILVILALSGGLVFFMTKGCEKDSGQSGGPGGGSAPVVAVDPVSKPPIIPLPDVPGSGSDKVDDESPEEIFKTLGVGVSVVDPETLVERIGRALEKGDVTTATKLIGRKALNPEQLVRLRAMAAEEAVKLNKERPVSEIGELELNRRARWALNLDDDYGSRIYFDLQRDLQGRWGVDKMMLPPILDPEKGDLPISRAMLVDALGITDAFLQAALAQDFQTAKSFVDLEKVSDAKIAGLCIIFEEGNYRLRPKKPLRAMFIRETAAAFMANVELPDGVEVAQLGMSVQRVDKNSPWRVTEINLDTLLADYADRVAGGDIYYTPLIRNPEGGDTLILYFEFDENELTARTKRQLEIVALLLQTDGAKKLTISGHTDSLGTAEYNRELSSTRAIAVKDFLVDSGVDPKQIKTVAFGKSAPRRPNQTDSGEDDPEGRRANRRTEIYLNF